MFSFLVCLLQLGTPAPETPSVSDAPVSPTLDASMAGWSTFWWGDFDDDGLADAWVVRSGGEGRLLHNAGDGRFNDVTERVGLADQDPAHMALWSDFDQDGRLDLFLAAWDQPSRLLRQATPGQFTDVAREAGLGEAQYVVDAEWLDYDSDGAVDLHLTTAAEEVLYHNTGHGDFERIVLDLPAGTPFGSGSWLASGPDEARRQRGLEPVLPGEAGAGANGPDMSAIGIGGQTGSSTTGFCAPGVEDSSMPGVCIPANSIPTLGQLFPLSTELFVEAGSGRVGIGTTNPGVRLDVVGGNVRTDGRLVSTVSSGPPLVVGSTDRVPSLNADFLDGFHASAFSQLGNRIETNEIAQGAVTATKLAANSVGTFTIGDGGVQTADIGDGVVTSSKLDDDLSLSGDLTVEDRLLAGNDRVRLLESVDGAGIVNVFSPAGDYNLRITNHASDAGRGAVTVFDESGIRRAGMWVNASGIGEVFGDVKNFVAANPSDPSTEIWYASLEGPEAAAYARGTATLVGGLATVQLPRHFQDVTSGTGITVVLTPGAAESRGLAVVEKSRERIVVRELLNGTGSYEFDWEVKAVRSGFEDYQVVRPIEHLKLGSER